MDIPNNFADSGGYAKSDGVPGSVDIYSATWIGIFQTENFVELYAV